MDVKNHQKQKDFLSEKEQLLTIQKIKAETRSLNVSILFDLLKFSLLGLAAIYVFFVIDLPSSKLNAKAQKEEISRERAKLVLDILKEENDTIVTRSLAVIEASYPKDSTDDWFKNIKILVEADNFIKAINDSINVIEPNQTSPRLDDTSKMYLSELKLLVNGTSVNLLEISKFKQIDSLKSLIKLRKHELDSIGRTAIRKDLDDL